MVSCYMHRHNMGKIKKILTFLAHNVKDLEKEFRKHLTSTLRNQSYSLLVEGGPSTLKLRIWQPLKEWTRWLKFETIDGYPFLRATK